LNIKGRKDRKHKREQINFFEDTPAEVALLFLRFMSVKSLANLSCTSKHIHRFSPLLFRSPSFVLLSLSPSLALSISVYLRFSFCLPSFRSFLPPQSLVEDPSVWRGLITRDFPDYNIQGEDDVDWKEMYHVLSRRNLAFIPFPPAK